MADESMASKSGVTALLQVLTRMILLAGAAASQFAFANCEGTGPCYCYGAVCTNTPPPQRSTSSSPAGGGLAPQQQMLLQGAGAIGNAIGEALRGNPEEHARRQAAAAQAAEQQRRAAEARRAEFLRQQELTKGRILGSLKDPESSGDLKLKADTESSVPIKHSPVPAGASAAVPVGQSLPTIGGLQLKAGENVESKPKTDAYNTGFNDASGCYSQNAGPYCMGASSGQQEACVAAYRAGFESGDKQRELVMQEAFQAGKQAGLEGALASGTNDSRAGGTCRVQWVEIYDRGYMQGKLQAKSARVER